MNVGVWLSSVMFALFTWYTSPSCACSSNDVVIGIDIGHTKKQSGAISARGVPEFVFNQSLATVIANELAAAGMTRGFLINADGRIGSLEDRPAEALLHHADLFLSVHHDSVQPQYLLPWIVNRARRLYSDRFHGYSLFVSNKNPAYSDSLRFASLIGSEMLKRGFSPTLHHAEPISGENRLLLNRELGIYQYNDLVVLKKSELPSVLIEAGIIVNRDEESNLTEPAYQAQIAAAIVSAAQAFCVGLTKANP